MTGGGGGGAIVTHHGPMTGGVVSKGGQIRVRLDAAPDAGQGFEKPPYERYPGKNFCVRNTRCGV